MLAALLKVSSVSEEEEVGGGFKCLHLSSQITGGGLMSRGAYRQKQYFCLQEDETITGERGGGAYNTAVYGMIT